MVLERLRKRAFFVFRSCEGGAGGGRSTNLTRRSEATPPPRCGGGSGETIRVPGGQSKGTKVRGGAFVESLSVALDGPRLEAVT